MKKWLRIVTACLLSIVFFYLLYSKLKPKEVQCPLTSQPNNASAVKPFPSVSPQLSQWLNFSFSYPAQYSVRCREMSPGVRECALSNGVNLSLVTGPSIFINNRTFSFEDFMREYVPSIYEADQPADVMTGRGSKSIGSERIADMQKSVNGNAVVYYKVYPLMVERRDGQVYRDYRAKSPTYFFDLSTGATPSAMIISFSPDQTMTASDEAVVQQIAASLEPTSRSHRFDF